MNNKKSFDDSEFIEYLCEQYRSTPELIEHFSTSYGSIFRGFDRLENKYGLKLKSHKEGRLSFWMIEDNYSDAIKKYKDAGTLIGTKMDLEEDGNEAQLSIKKVHSDRKKLSELLREQKHDIAKLDGWILGDQKASRWQQQSSDGKVWLHSIKANLKKKNPDKQQFPAIKKVEFELGSNLNVKKQERDIKKGLVIGDSHNGYNSDLYNSKLDPYHDRRALDITLQIAKDVQPDLIVILGDMLDLGEWSQHYLKSPEMYWTTQSALIELGWWFANLRKNAPFAKIVYIAGNHELRCQKAIKTNLLAAYKLKSHDNLDGSPNLSIPNLLSLDKYDIEYRKPYPKAEYWINDNLRCSHGEVARKSTAKYILRDTRNSEIAGHTHRIELRSKTSFPRKGPVSYTVYINGCLCRLDGIVPSKNSKENWQQGLGIVNYEEGNGLFHIEPIYITNGKALYEGKLYKGKNRIKEIYDDTEWKLFNQDSS